MPGTTKTPLILKAFPADLKVSEGERAVTARISTAAVDRDGEVLEPKGLISKNFEKNPVVLFNHDSYSLPIGKCVSLVRGEKEVTAKTIFAERPKDYPADAEWLPDTVFSLFQQGILNAFSVGFNPVDMPRAATQRDTEKFGDGVKRVFGKWELLEYSVVTIPANQDAVAVAVGKSFDRAKQYIDEQSKPKGNTKVNQKAEFTYHLPRTAEVLPTVDRSAIATAELIKATRKARGYVYAID